MTETLFFTSISCGGCKEMYPVLQELGKEGYKIKFIDFQKERNIADKYGVMTLPTIIILEKTKEVARFVGKVSIEKLRNIMKKKADYQIW